MPPPPRGAARHGSRLRFPIALKIALCIALLAVAIMAWQAHAAVRVAGAHLEREANASGVRLVSAIAALIPADWVRTPRHRDELLDMLRRFDRGPAAERVRDIVIYDAAGTPVAVLGSIEVTAGHEVEWAPARRAGVRITEHRANGVPVRTFSKAIRRDRPDLDGGEGGEEEAGRVDILLSAQHIAESRRAVVGELVRTGVLACLAAAAASFVVASLLARPVRILARDLRQVGRGDLEHRTSVDSNDELGELGRTFNRMASNLHAAQEAKIAQKALEHELSIATGIQERLLPPTTPSWPSLDIAVHYAAAREVGGDYYDFLSVDEDRLGVIIADVSGKGVPGSLVMTMTRSLLHMAAPGCPDPAEVVRLVDSSLAPDLQPGMFVTLLYAVVTPGTGEAALVRAGHNAPFLWRASARQLLRLQPRGVAIGIERTGALLASELTVKRFRLDPGDVLLAYTDGVTEAKNPQGEDYGEDRLGRVLARNAGRSAGEIADAVVADVEAHRDGTEPSDDLTLLVLRARRPSR